jgi:multidrug efflux pump subunit AcrA (membrane-fusion protein)
VEVLAEREARARDLMPTDEDVLKAFQTEYDLIVKEYYHGDPSAYDRDIRLREQDPEKHAARRQQEIRAQLTLAHLAQADRVVSDEQVERRFTDLFGALSERSSLDVAFFSMYREVVPGERPNIPMLKEAALERAQAAVAKLRNGKPISDVLADSDPVNSDFVDEQGRIKSYSRRLLGKEVEVAIASLDEPGDVSPPISVFDGYYVVQLVGRVPVELDEVREDVITDILTSPANSSEIAIVREHLMNQEGVEILLR